MLARVRTFAIQGVGAYSVDVEADVSKGRSGFSIIGLGDNAVREASERVRNAIKYSGLIVPKRTLINLAPAEVKKEGSLFDLPIAIAVLLASKQLKTDLDSMAFFGELSLDGRVKGIKGIVALVLQAKASGIVEVIVPAENFQEASLVTGILTIPVDSINDILWYFRTGEVRSTPKAIPTRTKCNNLSLSDVVGQQVAKRAFQIAAAGGHHILMVGPPGCGKSMLAARFSSLLPKLSQEETHQVVQIHSLAGMPVEQALSGHRPFRSPHHGVSEAGLIGGGSRPKPGEISLAHRGVLFLDEFPEFRRSALESLRGPIENRRVTIARAKGSVTYPAEFQLIAAMNACPCGRSGVPNMQCLCGEREISNYLKKLSQPLLDRFDIQIELDAVPLKQIESADTNSAEGLLNTEDIFRVRKLSLDERGSLNAELSNQILKKSMQLSDCARSLIDRVIDQGLMSARGYFRILRVSRTIADLDGSNEVCEEHLAEAVQFRTVDRLISMLA